MTSRNTLRTDEIFTVGPEPKRIEMPLGDTERNMWKQARNELLGFALHLERGNAGLTAAQIRMAVMLADDTYIRSETVPSS